MLVDITLKVPSDEIIAKTALVFKSLGIPYQWDMYHPKRVVEGVYWSGFRPNDDIEEDLFEFDNSAGNLLHLKDEKRDPLTVMRDDGFVASWGVCDGLENILSHKDYTPILTGPRRFTLFLTPISREENGGWRWHKWGPYIGTYEPQYEYLKDESIDGVTIFKILEHT